MTGQEKCDLLIQLTA